MSSAINVADDAISGWESCLNRLEAMCFRTNDDLYDFVKWQKGSLRNTKEDLKKARQKP